MAHVLIGLVGEMAGDAGDKWNVEETPTKSFGN